MIHKCFVKPRSIQIIFKSPHCAFRFPCFSREPYSSDLYLGKPKSRTKSFITALLNSIKIFRFLDISILNAIICIFLQIWRVSSNIVGMVSATESVNSFFMVLCTRSFEMHKVLATSRTFTLLPSVMIS